MRGERWEEPSVVAVTVGVRVEVVRSWCRRGRLDAFTLPGGRGWRIRVDERGRPLASG